jgi:hypothetical protein
VSKRRSPAPGVCVVCERPKSKARLPYCRECSRQMRAVDRLLRPDNVLPRVGALRWAGRLPLEGR